MPGVLRSRLHRIPWGILGLEFVVVMMGVLAALWVEEWREESSRRATEAVYLERLRDDVGAGLEEVRLELERVTGAEGELRLGLGLLDSPGTPARADSLRSAVGWLWQLVGASVPNATWRELVASGNLGVLQDQELRRILTAYELALGDLDRVEGLQTEQYLRSGEPFVQRRLNVGEIATVRPDRVRQGGPPGDLAGLWGDRYAWNLLNTRLETVISIRQALERVEGVQGSLLGRLAELGYGAAPGSKAPP